MKTLIAAATAVVALSTAALAEKAVDQRAWMDTIDSYSLKHPMEVTCSEFVSAQAEEQEYVVAYLEGHAHSSADLEVIEDYQPVSVISITEECKDKPDTNVWDVVKSSTPYIN